MNSRIMPVLRGPALLAIAILLAGTLANIGCERAPAPVTELPAIPASVVMADSSGEGYDWPVGATGFVVAKPPPFAFLRNLEPDPEAELEAHAAEAAEPSEPLDAETAATWAARIGSSATPPFAMQAELTPLMQADLPDSGPAAYAISDDGQRLLVAGETVTVYDVASGNQLASSATPGGRLQASLWPPGEHFYVADAQNIYQGDANTGMILQAVAELAQPIATWQHGALSHIIFGCYENGHIFRLDGQTGQFNDLVIKVHGSTKQVAVKPDGQGFITVVEAGLATYWLDGERIVDEHVSRQTTSFAPSTMCWSGFERTWCDGRRFISLANNTPPGTESEPFISAPLLWRPVALKAGTPASEGFIASAWTTAIVMREDENGAPTLSICDLYPNRFVNSTPTSLPVSEQTPIASNGDGTVLAFSDEQKIRVVRRPAWEHCQPFAVNYAVNALFAADDFEQLEMLGRYLLETDQLRWAYSPQEMYDRLVDAVGDEWFYLKRRVDAAEDEEQRAAHRARFDAVRDWAKTSPLGKLALANLRIDIAWAARGDGLGHTVTEGGWTVFSKQLDLAAKELDALLSENPDAPMAAYKMRVTCAMGRGESHDAFEPILRQAVARYVDEPQLHLNVAFWLTPRWSGSDGDSAGYLDAVLKHCDPDTRDRVYACVVADLHFAYSNPAELYVWDKFKDALVMRGIRLYLKQNPTQRDRLAYMLISAKAVQDQQLRQMLVRHYRSRLMFVSLDVYNKHSGRLDDLTNDLP